MSRLSGKGKDSPDEGKARETSSSLVSDDDEESDNAAIREETPDLYRNSALGMYGGVVHMFQQVFL
jgi:E3 ubiquitin-protein ligase HUWE1